jgi:biopolymer transport protein ExbB
MFEQIWHTWVSGGVVMLSLAMLSLAIYFIAIRVLLLLRHRGIKNITDVDIRKWMADPKTSPPDVKDMVKFIGDDIRDISDIESRIHQIEHEKIGKVERYLSILSVMIVSAPLFGLLGTVLGMLLTFKAISVGGSSASEIVAKGISEALTATQTGLMIAIPGWMLGYMAKR